MKKKKNIVERFSKFIKESVLRFSNNLKHEAPIFIVGCGHSGTTLLLRILANHKNLYGVPYESKAMQGNYPKISEVLKWRKAAKNEGVNRWVEKTPKHIQYIDRILHLFPKAKIIVIQRDGRDVTVSIRKRYGDSDLGINRWIEDNKAGLKYSNHPRVMYVRLEDFTSQPEILIKKVCDHIGEKYYSGLLDYQNAEFKYDNQTPIKTDKVEGENHIKNRVWQVNQPIFKNTSKWKKEATEYEMAQFEKNSEFIALMKELNYLN